jgi:hypothetical protein
MRVLEPSVGIGHFFGLMPEALRGNAMLFGVELDPTSAAIAKQLYQRADIANRGFQDVPVPEGFFDLAIGNPPFGEQRMTDTLGQEPVRQDDPQLLLRQGDEVAAPRRDPRHGGEPLLHGQGGAHGPRGHGATGYFLGGVRLPNTAFKQNARTEVTTDILFFQKRGDHGGDRPTAWTETGEVSDPKSGEPIRVNRYFAEHPEQMLGTMTLEGSMYREGEPTLSPREGLDLADGIRDALARLPENVYTEIPDEQRVSFQVRHRGRGAERREGGRLLHAAGRLHRPPPGRPACVQALREGGGRGQDRRPHQGHDPRARRRSASSWRPSCART